MNESRAAAALARYAARVTQADVPPPEPAQTPPPPATAPTPTAGRCIVCATKLVTEREAIRCEPCQAAGLWAPLTADTDDTAIPTRTTAFPAGPRHHGPGWRVTTHAEGLALCGLDGEVA